MSNFNTARYCLLDKSQLSANKKDQFSAVSEYKLFEDLSEHDGDYVTSQNLNQLYEEFDGVKREKRAVGSLSKTCRDNLASKEKNITFKIVSLTEKLKITQNTMLKRSFKNQSSCSNYIGNNSIKLEPKVILDTTIEKLDIPSATGGFESLDLLDLKHQLPTTRNHKYYCCNSYILTFIATFLS
jgi:hypothetical protein